MESVVQAGREPVCPATERAAAVQYMYTLNSELLLTRPAAGSEQPVCTSTTQDGGRGPNCRAPHQLTHEKFKGGSPHKTQGKR